ncbi:MAG: hypothetical protein MUC53_03470 [Candidatus Contendobacter sp.]|jgi:hypothetical protein|nr:hypothetical protein [Candidatus Contendobacter sp.]
MKAALAASFALIAALSTLAPSAPAVAEANRHGYVNYRNYEEGPESLAAFRAYHRNARFGAAVRSEPSAPATAGAPSTASSVERTAVGAHCQIAPRVGFQNSTSIASC